MENWKKKIKISLQRKKEKKKERKSWDRNQRKMKEKKIGLVDKKKRMETNLILKMNAHKSKWAISNIESILKNQTSRNSNIEKR